MKSGRPLSAGIPNGTNFFEWDAENRLIKINYPGIGNFTQFDHDPKGQLIKLTETSSSVVTLLQQFVLCGEVKCEERNVSGSMSKEFFSHGLLIGASSYFYSRDGISSVRELCNSTGVIQAQYQFEPFGQIATVSEAVPSDFRFAGYFFHSRSMLHLATFREYSSRLGRWLNRDPIQEEGGLNMMSYVANNPISYIDPNGLDNELTAAGYLEDRSNVNCYGHAWGTGTHIQAGPGQKRFREFAESVGVRCQPIPPFGLCKCDDPSRPHPSFLVFDPRTGSNPYNGKIKQTPDHAFIQVNGSYVDTAYKPGYQVPVRSDWLEWAKKGKWYCCCSCKPPNPGKKTASGGVP